MFKALQPIRSYNKKTCIENEGYFIAHKGPTKKETTLSDMGVRKANDKIFLNEFKPFNKI